MSCPYSEALMTQTDVSYITYNTSSYKQTGDIITFAQFEEGGSLENERDLVFKKPILGSIVESSAKDNSDD